MADAPDDIDDLRRHLGAALALMTEKAPGYRLGKAYYEGTRSEVFATVALEALLSQSAAFAPISLAHIPVDVIADKVELASVVTDGAGAEALSVVVDGNDLESESDDYVRKACYFGDYYAIIDPTEEEDDDAAKITAEGLRVTGSSPLSTIVVYDAKYGREARYGVKVWTVGSGALAQTKALLFYNDVTVRLASSLGVKDPKPTDFDYDVEPGEDADAAIILHPGGKILVKHLAIGGKPYGVPLHRKAWGPQDAVTKISATNLTNVDAQGFASRWALTDPAAEIDDDIDDDFGDNGPTTDPSNTDGITTATTGKSRVRSTPGAITILRGVKAVGQFTATGSDDFLKNLDWYVRVMAVATGIPLFEFDLTGEQPSGESRRRAEGRANKKAAKVKREAGAFFEAIGDTVLALLGSAGTVAATFNPSETSTDKDGLELVSLKIKTGVPVAQALLEAGYTEEQVAKWYPEGRPAITPEVLGILATALAQLGNAKTLGVLTDDDLVAMLPEILKGARGDIGPLPPADDDLVE
jgi:hypothetical protein